MSMKKKVIGMIHFYASREDIPYTDAEKLIQDFKDELYCVGVGGVDVTLNSSDPELHYRIFDIKAGEYGADIPKRQYLLSYHNPAFRLSEKLAAIYKHETMTGTKRRITEPHNDYFVVLKSGILKSMSNSAIKNLVDSRYEKAARYLERMGIRHTRHYER